MGRLGHRSVFRVSIKAENRLAGLVPHKTRMGRSRIPYLFERISGSQASGRRVMARMNPSAQSAAITVPSEVS